MSDEPKIYKDVLDQMSEVHGHCADLPDSEKLSLIVAHLSALVGLLTRREARETAKPVDAEP